MNSHKPKVLILFYSMYGHMFALAKAVAEGVREAGGEALIMQVAELIPEARWDENIKGAKLAMKDIPIATPQADGVN